MSKPNIHIPYSVNAYGPVPELQVVTELAMKEGFIHSGCLNLGEQGKILNPQIDFGEVIVGSLDATSHTSTVIYKDDQAYTYVCRRATNTDKPIILQVYHFNKTWPDCQAYNQALVNEIVTVEVPDDKVPVTFWYLDEHGPSCYGSDIVVPSWEEIRKNYPANLAGNLDALVNYKLDSENGSLILLHGLAGAGKTYFIRALLKAWKNQCQINYVVDVDSLFGRGGSPYLVKMLAPDSDERFKLFILEDTGEMVSKDARQMVGQGLSRMLNVSDGILGQGCKLIMLMTTNEELGTLHSAISRPGRCFANIEFNSFPPNEAKSWLVGHSIENVPVTKHMSLAELYEIRNQHLIVNQVEKRIGF